MSSKKGRLTRTLSNSRFKKQLDEGKAFPGINSKRRIKADIQAFIHGAQNIPTKGVASASCSWSRGRKSSGVTPIVDIVFGMATFKHRIQLEVTFEEDTVSQTAQPKFINFVVKTHQGKKKGVLVGKAMVDLGEFYRDGTRQEKIFTVTVGSKPVTLKCSFETTWLQIDNKRIVRASRGRQRLQQEQEEQEYDMETVTFESQDESNSDIGGLAGLDDVSDIDFSDEIEGGAGDDSLLRTLEEQGEVLAEYKSQVEELTSMSDHLKKEVQRYEAKIDTYRENVKAKNAQIETLKKDVSQAAGESAGSDARLEATKDKLLATKVELEAAHALIQNERQKFQSELGEIQAQTETMRAQLKLRAEAEDSAASNLGALIDGERDQNSKLRQMLEEANQREAALEKERSANQEAISALQAELRQLTKQFHEQKEDARLKEEAHQVVQVQLSEELGAEREALRGALESREAALHELSQGASGEAMQEQLEADRRALREQLEASRQSLEQANGQLATQRDHVTLVRRESAAKDSFMAAAEKQLLEYQQRIHSMEAAHLRLQEVSAQQEARLKDLEAAERTQSDEDKIAEQAAQIVGLELQLSSLSIELKRAQSQAQSEVQQLTDAHAKEIQLLRQEAVELKASLQEELRPALEDVSFANEKLLKEQQVSQDLARKLQDTEERVVNLLEEQERIKKEAAVLLQEMEVASTQRINELEQTSSLRADVKELNQELDSLTKEHDEELEAQSVAYKQKLLAMFEEHKKQLMEKGAKLSAAEALAEERGQHAQQVQELEQTLKQELVSVQKKLTEAHKETIEATTKADQLARDCSVLKVAANRVQVLEAEAQETHKQIEGFRLAQVDSQAARSKLEKKVKEMESLLQRATEEAAADREASVVQLNREREAAAFQAQKLAESRAQCDEISAEKAELEQHVERVNRQVVTLKASLEDSQRQISASQVGAGQQVKTLMAQMDALRDKADTVDGLMSDLAGLQSKVVVLETQLDELSETERQLEVETLRSAQLSRQLDALSKELESSRKSASEAKQTGDSACKLLEKQVGQLARQVAVLDEADTKAKELETKLAALEPRSVELGVELEVANSKVVSLSDKLASVELEFRQEIDAQTRVFEERAMTAAEKLSNLQSRLQVEQIQKREFSEKVEQLSLQLQKLESEKERQVGGAAEEAAKESSLRKTIISSVLLGNKPDGGDHLVTRVKEWQDEPEALHKVANAFMLLFRDDPSSYQHGVRVLGKISAFMGKLAAAGFKINNPISNGVLEPSNCGDLFVDKLESACHQIAQSLVRAVFKRMEVFLAPALLSHMPAKEDLVDGGYQIEETVVESGVERGKFMTNTILFILTDLRNHIEKFALAPLIAQQVYSTLCANLNAYLFQYIIQTPAVCTSSNGFTIRLRLSLLDDWFSQPRNELYSGAFAHLKPVQEAALLLFIDRGTLEETDTLLQLFPSLNMMQIMSILEMISPCKMQATPVSSATIENVNRAVEAQAFEGHALFFKPVNLLAP